MEINLKKIRQQRNLSETQLSKLSGVALSYISEIESGKYSNPGVEVLCKLCKVLECGLDDLVNCRGG